MVEPRQLPLARLDDHVDGAALQLAESQLEPELVELLPAVARLEGGRVLVDPPVPCDEREPELADVPRFDLAHLARHQVVMEEAHQGRLVACLLICPSIRAGPSIRSRSFRQSCWQCCTPVVCGRCAHVGRTCRVGASLPSPPASHCCSSRSCRPSMRSANSSSASTCCSTSSWGTSRHSRSSQG